MPRVEHYYGSIALFSSVLHNVFLLYHVEVFVSVYQIDRTSFWVGETIFLVWNCLNDPLFGWLSDCTLLGRSGGEDVVGRRVRLLQWAGPLFCLAFLTLWVSWATPGLQFVVCLCVYDGFLTLVDLHHSSLLADMAVSANARTDLNFYSSLFSAVGSLSVFVSYAVWNRQQPEVFQIFCATLAVAAFLGFMFSTSKLRQLCDLQKPRSTHLATHDISSQSAMPLQTKALSNFVHDLVRHKNFMWFSVMNLIQVFHCHFNSNFFPLFLDSLLGDSVPQVVCSLILGVSFIVPHINNLYFLSFCRRYGVYSVIKALFVFKFLLSAAMIALGSSHIWLLCIYIASNRVFTEGTCKLLNLVVSDLVDEDYVLHHRKQAVSALVFGTAALLSKPGQTLAPLVGTWLLALQSGYDVFEHRQDSMKPDSLSISDTERGEYRDGIFLLLVCVPAVCALLQLMVWAHFTLKGDRLKWVKAVREGSVYAL